MPEKVRLYGKDGCTGCQDMAGKFEALGYAVEHLEIDAENKRWWENWNEIEKTERDLALEVRTALDFADGLLPVVVMPDGNTMTHQDAEKWLADHAEK